MKYINLYLHARLQSLQFIDEKIKGSDAIVHTLLFLTEACEGSVPQGLQTWMHLSLQ